MKGCVNSDRVGSTMVRFPSNSSVRRLDQVFGGTSPKMASLYINPKPCKFAAYHRGVFSSRSMSGQKWQVVVVILFVEL